MKSEWDIFHRAQKGNIEAWHELTKNYQPRLLSLAVMITGSPAAAEDIVQETFLRAYEAIISNTSGTVKGYLGTIAYRLSIKEKHRRQHSENINSVNMAHNDPDSLTAMLKDERDRIISGAIRKLDDKHRETLLLRFYADQSYEQIADLLGISIGTVKSRIFYAVKRCRDILIEEGIFE